MGYTRNMRKPVLLLTATLGLSLAQSAMPPLNFSAQGKSTRMPDMNQSAALTWNVTEDGIKVGTITPSGTVNMQIDPQMLKDIELSRLSDVRTSEGNCDTSNLNVVQEVGVYWLFRLHYVANGTKYEVRPGKLKENSDGSVTLNLQDLIYAEKTGSLKGTKHCGSDMLSLDLDLKPGWNLIDDSQTYNFSTNTWDTIKLRNARPVKSYDGPWVSLKE